MLFQRGFAPLLAFSGPATRPLDRQEADVRADMARLFGVSSSAIVTETTARTTHAEALRMAALLQALAFQTWREGARQRPGSEAQDRELLHRKP